MTQHRARKRFGQNFLQDQSIIRNIVRAAAPDERFSVVEIGPGLGALTRLLAERAPLHVIEIDRDIVAFLERQPYAPRLTIHQGDVLDFDFSSIAGRKKIIGNLPYNISTPLLFRLAQYADETEDMHFMLQKEVVDRMVAAPATPDYGRLGIMLQYAFEMEKLIDVPPEAFDPAPKVDSAVVRMIPAKGRIGIAANEEAFAEVVRLAFSQRRKTLRNNLKTLLSDDDLAACGIDPAARAEQLPPEAYVVLADFLHAKRQGQLAANDRFAV